MAESKQTTLDEKWTLDGLPNDEEPTEESLAQVAWFREQEEKKNNPKK